MVLCRWFYGTETIVNVEKFKDAWAKSDRGGKAILAGGGLAVFSMLLPWVDIGVASRNGISQGTFLLLGLWFYPVRQILGSEEIDRKIGLGCGIGGLLITMGFIDSKSLGPLGNATGVGAYLFFVACCWLIYGVLSHKPSSPPTA